MSATTEQRLNDIVVRKGGVRLDSGWGGVDGRVHLRCAHNHEWWVKAASILYSGSWCRSCEIDRRRNGHKQADELATKFDGQCISMQGYETVHSKLRWRCKHGHEFERSIRSVQMGRWCQTCAAETGPRNLGGFDGALRIAREAGGEHLGTVKSSIRKTKWRCKNGHEFESTGKSILNRVHFCPVCSKARPVTLDMVQALCETRGGRCVSDTYVNNYTKLEFECAQGHRWFANWRMINGKGSWCPTCARTSNGIDRLLDIATLHGGELLSGEYVNAVAQYEWRCGEGHAFNATPPRARNRWCPTCPPPEHFVERDAHELIAFEWGGECVDKRAPRWRCGEGHEFSAALSSAAMVWCPACRNGQHVAGEAA